MTVYLPDSFGLLQGWYLKHLDTYPRKALAVSIRKWGNSDDLGMKAPVKVQQLRG